MKSINHIGRFVMLVTLFLMISACEDWDDVMMDSAEMAPLSLYIFGDSWAELIGDGPIQNELLDRALDDVLEPQLFGIGGTTMAQWADDDDGMRSELADAILSDPSANPIVFFTLSGNDLLDGGSSIDDVLDNLATVLTSLTELRDDLHIVFGGYDILNATLDASCEALFTNLVGSAEPSIVNGTFVEMFERAEAVVATYDQAISVDTYGALQGRPGNPDLNQWSETSYLADCIHLNDKGHDIYLDTIFVNAILPHLCATHAEGTDACDS